MAKARTTRPTGASAPRPAARAKKPRTKGKSALTRAVSPDLLLPRRKAGTPLKIVPRTDRAPGTDPLWRRALRDPNEMAQAFSNRPGWVDDVAAILLISFGMVSLLALLNVSAVASTALSDMWADLISQIFGRVGAALLSVLLAAAGVVIALPRLNIVIRLPWRRVLGIETAYLALLALLHLLANDPEPRALARSGQGGGHIGWALGEIMARLFGSWLATLFYVIILIVALFVIFGVRRTHMRAALKALSRRLDAFAEQLRGWAANARTARPPMPDAAHGHVTLLPPHEPDAALAETRRTVLEQTAAMASPMPTSAAERGTESASPVAESERVAPAPAAIGARSGIPRPVVPPRPVPVAPVAKGSTADVTPSEPSEPSEPAEPPSPPQPAVAVPIGPSRSVTPMAAPSPRPERTRRHFTVQDFTEARRPVPREGLPPITLLNDVELNRPTEEEINTNVSIIENTLLEFDIDVEVIDVRVGPTITQYAVQPFREVSTDEGATVTQRVRVNKIASLSNDLALALAAKRLRIQPYVPGHPYMGIEVPNRAPGIVALRPVMESEAFARAFLRPDPDSPSQQREMPLVVPLGRDVSGEPVIVDLAAMPHLLIAGTTGSGKSVCITALIAALVMNNLPDRVKLVMLDPKMVELTRFNGLPHLLGPVETDIERVIGVLRWATREMDRRFKLLEVEAARNIEAYNRALGRRRKAEHLPYIVIFVDEIGDLMLSRPEDMERTVTRLAQMARAVGMHLVVATQRPSTDVITGLIKANFPARISFAVASGVDSRVILDTTGADALVGRGDMLYLAPDAAVPRRLQGCYVTDPEIDAIVAWWRRWQSDQEMSGSPPMEIAPWERGISRRESLSEHEAMLEDAIDLAVREGEVSVALLQRRLGTTYPRAAQLMDLLNQLGILGATRDDGRTRDVTMKPGTDPYKKLMAKYRRR